MTLTEFKRKFIKTYASSIFLFASNPLSEIQAPDPNNDSILSGITASTDCINLKEFSSLICYNLF